VRQPTQGWSRGHHHVDPAVVLQVVDKVVGDELHDGNAAQHVNHWQAIETRHCRGCRAEARQSKRVLTFRAPLRAARSLQDVLAHVICHSGPTPQLHFRLEAEVRGQA